VADRFDRFCHFKRMKLKADEDWVSVYDGREGSGKSTGAIWDAKATSGALFNFRKYICYDPEELMRLVDDTPQYGTIILDEAGEAFFSRSFRNHINIAIAKTLQQMRYRNLNVILCVPHKDYIDLIGRNRCRSWAHFDANKRGKAEFLMPFRSKYYSRDEPFWESFFYYQFSPLPPPFYAAYKAIKVKKSKERLAQYIEDVDDGKEKFKDETPSADDLAERIRKDAERDVTLNSKRRYDRDLIIEYFREKGIEVPFPLARIVSQKLNAVC